MTLNIIYLNITIDMTILNLMAHLKYIVFVLYCFIIEKIIMNRGNSCSKFNLLTKQNF